NVYAPLDIGTFAQRSSPCSSNSGKTPPPLAISPSSTPASGKLPGPSTLCGSCSTPPQSKFSPSSHKRALLWGSSTYPCAETVELKPSEKIDTIKEPNNAYKK